MDRGRQETRNALVAPSEDRCLAARAETLSIDPSVPARGSVCGVHAAAVRSPIYVAAPVDVFDLDEVCGISDRVYDSVVAAARRVGPFQFGPQGFADAMGVGSERSENELHAGGRDLVGQSLQVASSASGDAYLVKLTHA